MNYTNDNIDKICNFYMSDWHFIVMVLPYINKQISQKTKVITCLERDVIDKVQFLIEKLSLKNKEEILKINWKKTEIKNFKKYIKDDLKKENNKILIINGSNYYIEEINKLLSDTISNEKCKCKNIKIIDCYDFESNKDDMNAILKKYRGILNTSGETTIKEIM